MLNSALRVDRKWVTQEKTTEKISRNKVKSKLSQKFKTILAIYTENSAKYTYSIYVPLFVCHLVYAIVNQLQIQVSSKTC